MSNLLKRGSTISKEERVIDYNELIKEKLSLVMQENTEDDNSDGFINGLTADVVEKLVSDDEQEDTASAATLEDIQKQAQEIIDGANQQAAQIIEQANQQIEEDRRQAEQQGYDDGMMKADRDIAKREESLKQEYDNRCYELENEYIEKKKNVESEVVSLLCDVFSRFIKTDAEDNHEILMHLINEVLDNADKSHNYSIKVSAEDYPFVSENQGKIFCSINKDINVDVVQDQSMTRGQCIIETDGGVFDCGIDIELTNLIKKLKLLSCQD